jgi:hypothetical protein
MAKRIPPLSKIAKELGSADFGDERLGRRLGNIAEAIAPAPEKSFPKVASSESELEAIYRFVNNDKVTPEKIFGPHVAATVGRVGETGLVRVLHDSTALSFGGATRREGLGRLCANDQGFIAHTALAITGDGQRVPLGILGLRTLVRTRPRKKRTAHERHLGTNKESERWLDLALEVHGKLAAAPAVHVMDSEADAYALLSAMKQHGMRFVVRVRYDRVIIDEGEKSKVSIALASADDSLTREVPLSRRQGKRPPYTRKHHPPRNGRIAQLRFRAVSVQFKRPEFADGVSRASKGLPPELAVNLVQVYEPEPPPGEEAVEWTLVTTEPIATKEQVATVVDTYRDRWVIEELFKALKTGCAIEKRQLETGRALQNALAIYLPMATRLLLLRTVGRAWGAVPATHVLTETEVLVLRAISKRVALPARPTTEQAMLAIAGLGGHLKRNGLPGWQTLGYGYQRLIDAIAATAVLRGLDL